MIAHKFDIDDRVKVTLEANGEKVTFTGTICGLTYIKRRDDENVGRIYCQWRYDIAPDREEYRNNFLSRFFLEDEITIIDK